MRPAFGLFAAALLAAPAGAADPPFPPLPRAVSSFGAAVAGDHVYVYGGHAGKTHTYSTESTVGTFRRLSLADPGKGWEELPAGPHAQGLALVAHGGKLIRVGGMQPRNEPGDPADNHSLASVARFDPAAGRWEDLPDLPAGRSSHDAAVVGDTLVVVGGWRMGGAGKAPEWHDTALLLDLADPKAKWEAVPQPFQRRALSAAVAGGKVYAVAGLTADGGTAHEVNVFDPAARTWATAATLPGGRMNGFSPAAVAVGDTVYASPADGVVYRLAGDAWEPAGKLATPRFVHRVVPIGGGRLLALGGASKGGNVAASEVVTPAPQAGRPGPPKPAGGR
jgi:N-acetylneuraminic acid mutarotase